MPKAGVSIRAGYRRSTAACRTSYRHLFGCPERWKSHFRASRFQIFSRGRGGMPPDPLGKRGLAAPLVVTAAYYTFSGRL